ncbi:MAG: hypothetical protein ABSE57_30995 [Bryobacteraceae bacterium]|jgi:hypothetical protein
MGVSDQLPHPNSPLGGGGPGGFRGAGPAGGSGYHWTDIVPFLADMSVLSVRVAVELIAHPGWLKPPGPLADPPVSVPAKVQPNGKDGKGQVSLSSYLGKNISEICPNHYADPDDNHCAHFVSHMLGYQFGVTCGQMKNGPGPAANIRVQEVFGQCPAVGEWSAKPADMLYCLVFITNASNVDLKNKKMTNVPRKHVGIFVDGLIWHYSNSKHQVVNQTPDAFSHHYAAPSNAMFYGQTPQGS